MKLTPDQFTQFDRNGNLFSPGCLTPGQTRNLTDEVHELDAKRERYNVREKARRHCAPTLRRICTARNSLPANALKTSTNELKLAALK